MCCILALQIYTRGTHLLDAVWIRECPPSSSVRLSYFIARVAALVTSLEGNDARNRRRGGWRGNARHVKERKIEL